MESFVFGCEECVLVNDFVNELCYSESEREDIVAFGFVANGYYWQNGCSLQMIIPPQRRDSTCFGATGLSGHSLVDSG